MTFFGFYPDSTDPSWLDQAEIGESVTFVAKVIDNYVQKKDTGFGVYNMIDEREEDTTSFNMSGVFTSFLTPEQSYKVEGVVGEYRGKKQVRGFKASFVQPTTKKGIVRYLQTLDGLNKRAEDIYDEFGDESIQVLLNDPQKVVDKIRGIGIKSAKKWQDELISIQMNSETTIGLLSLGLSKNQVRIIIERYGGEALEKIQTNPYLLAVEIKGYGFLKCDKIAKAANADLKGSNRIKAAILYILQESVREGHCFLSREELLRKTKDLLVVFMDQKDAEELSKKFIQTQQPILPFKVGKHGIEVKKESVFNLIQSGNSNFNQVTRYNDNHVEKLKLLDVETELIAEGLADIVAHGPIEIQEERVYLRDLYEAEKRVAEKLFELSLERSHEVDVHHAVEVYLSQKGYVLEDKQRLAVEKFTKSRTGVHILNGSAGCGKTFVLNIILDVMEIVSDKKLNIMVLAPTGRAAKVAAQSTSREALTIHKSLAYNPNEGFTVNKENPLDTDVLVVDEFSMVDIKLLSNLLDAVRNNVKVIFIGDHNQLPSVGPGRVLKDLLDVGKLDLVTLDVLKRQDAESGIAINADKILNGRVPESQLDTEDAYVLEVEGIHQMQAFLKASVRRFFERGYSWEDSQVLVPMRASEAGIDALNHLLQSEFNQTDNELTFLNKKIRRRNQYNQTVQVELNFKEEDKVMHIKNNYGLKRYKDDGTGQLDVLKETGVMNGEVGIISLIEIAKNDSGQEEKRIWVKYDDNILVCYRNQFGELDHAYAMTIHKSQGSQWKATILLIMNTHFRMLENEIFYTGYSRAKELQVTIGETTAIQRAVSTYTSKERNTYLKEYLERIIKESR